MSFIEQIEYLCIRGNTLDPRRKIYFEIPSAIQVLVKNLRSLHRGCCFNVSKSHAREVDISKFVSNQKTFERLMDPKLRSLGMDWTPPIHHSGVPMVFTFYTL